MTLHITEQPVPALSPCDKKTTHKVCMRGSLVCFLCENEFVLCAHHQAIEPNMTLHITEHPVPALSPCDTKTTHKVCMHVYVCSLVCFLYVKMSLYYAHTPPSYWPQYGAACYRAAKKTTHKVMGASYVFLFITSSLASAVLMSVRASHAKYPEWLLLMLLLSSIASNIWCVC